uniref:Uncharacterized protein n=1 Tax=Anguilla anguilla TaxID=7936 RepID=A0A0E9S9P2_ANGAN
MLHAILKTSLELIRRGTTHKNRPWVSRSHFIHFFYSFLVSGKLECRKR